MRYKLRKKKKQHVNRIVDFLEIQSSIHALRAVFYITILGNAPCDEISFVYLF